MFPELKILKNPVLLKKLFSIRKRIYTKISDLDVFVKTAEEKHLIDKDAAMKRIRRGSWGKPFTVGLFQVKGTIPEGFNKSKLRIIADIGGEGQLYHGEMPVIGLTNRIITPLDILQAHKGKSLIELDDAEVKNNDIDFYIDASFNGASIIMTPYGKCRFRGVKLVEVDENVKSFYYDFLTAAYRADEKGVSGALSEAYSLFKENKIADAKKVLEPIISTSEKVDFMFYAVGHSHLDLAWEWPLREGKRKSVRTISNQLRHIERYPGFIYGASQPQQFEWAKKEYPKFFEKIKTAVKDNRLEIQGGMWTESDTNVPSGESLVRQISYGQNFWKDNFDRKSNICWLPDVFGYSGNLPQILKKSGIPYFMTIKLSWNMYNKFPHQTFNWHGIDDSEVLVHMPPSGNYLGSGTPACFKDAREKFKEKDRLDKALFLFGAGDGGGGPSEAQLEVITRQAKSENAQVKFAPAEEFFAELNKDKGKLESYKGELYLEKHQGTYTTQCKTKLYNRLLENMLHTAEFLGATRVLRGKKYPSEMLDSIWKNVLLYQFHDIIPGSSITRVYKETDESYREMLDEIEQNIKGKKPTLLLNPSPFDCDANFLKEGKCYSFKAASYSTAQPKVVEANNEALKFDGTTIENDVIKAVFDEFGAIVSLYDKATGKEFAKGKLNDMRIYKDPYMYYSAWDLKRNYYNKSTKPLMLESSNCEIVGNILKRTQLLRRGKTYVEQEITIEAGSPIVIIKNKAALNRVFRQLRVDFEPSVWSNEVTCDIQFGNIKRPTGENNSIEKAMFEICAHKFVDLNDGKNGFAVLNNCKYGNRVKRGKISLNLIRNPIYPDSKADRGEQEFTFAIMPYEGAYENSRVLEKSYLLNQQPIEVSEEAKQLFEVSGGVVAETVKCARDGKSIVLRLYEPYGKKIKTKIKPLFEFAKAFETDLQEQNGKAAKLETEFSPFEIKTFVFERE